MICSAVLKLRAARDCRYQRFTGRGAQGFWLKSWRSVDPQVGDWLHAARWSTPLDGGSPDGENGQLTGGKESVAPYSISPLMDLPGLENGAQNIPAGTPAWLRVAAFHPDLARRMVEGKQAWLANLPERISIDGAEWWIEGASTDPKWHPWAGMSSYEALRHAALDTTAPPGRWLFRFLTPTAIRGAKVNGRDTYLLFPLPDRLLDSLLRCWNTFARFETGSQLVEIGDELIERARETMRVVHYRLETSQVSFQYKTNHSTSPRKEVPVTGYIGHAVLESLDSDAVRAVEDLLFRYAFYRGVGYHTTQGLGMARVEKDAHDDAGRG